jgi:fructoselysine-6-P-deglycase FrlB-like protein
MLAGCGSTLGAAPPRAPVFEMQCNVHVQHLAETVASSHTSPLPGLTTHVCYYPVCIAVHPLP